MNPKSPFRDTIFALSSGGLPSGVAVIRLSGPQAREAIIALAGDIPEPRRAVLRNLRNSEGVTLDHGLVLFFTEPASFTGEDSAEFQIHGGRAVVSAILHALAAVPGLRQAEAGEFSRRAFINGKIDLTGAEGLADLIAAETEAQRRLAIENVDGGQKTLYDTWRTRLLHARALIEAELDFSDESDVIETISDTTLKALRQLADDIQLHIDGFSAAEIIRDGFKVVLIGPPNVGKSSLLNALAKREVAIVTDTPGTTRDLIEVSLDLQGIKVTITDTAGIRQTDDNVEIIGVGKALEAAQKADLVLKLFDQNAEETDSSFETITDSFYSVATKIDLPQHQTRDFDYGISAITGEGLEQLVEGITARAQNAVTSTSNIIPTRLRHVTLLRSTQTSILQACEALEPELQAEELRHASDSLGKITGSVDVEELLGVIFSEFCIGK